ncbi:MAG: Rrf2 family transcriptional regulator [Pseudomonadota bacterium]
MKLSTRARYAIRAMVAVARLSAANQPISLERVARGTRVSRRYLEQLAIHLKRAALVKSVSGRNGGYLLARPAEEILIGEIVEAAIGPINIVDCVLEPEICMKSDCCECRDLYSLVNQSIRDTFNSLTLADLVAYDMKEAKLELA